MFHLSNSFFFVARLLPLQTLLLVRNSRFPNLGQGVRTAHYPMLIKQNDIIQTVTQ